MIFRVDRVLAPAGLGAWVGMRPRSLAVLAFVAGVACGPSGGDPTPVGGTGTGAIDPSSGSDHEGGSLVPGNDSTSRSAGESSGALESGGDTSSDGGPLYEDCVPRELEEGVGWWAFVDGDLDLQLGNAQGPCSFLQQTLPPTAPGTTELQLECMLGAATTSSVTLVLGFPLETLPFSVGETLDLAAAREPRGAINQQTLLTLRGAEGDLRLATFHGYAPGGKSPETADFFAPIQVALVGGVCPPPCEDDFGCVARAALDVSRPGLDPIRIFDGNEAVLAGDPGYAVRVAKADIGSLGIDDYGAHVDFVVTPVLAR
jgi:hypothetical protein